MVSECLRLGISLLHVAMLFSVGVNGCIKRNTVPLLQPAWSSGLRDEAVARGLLVISECDEFEPRTCKVVPLTHDYGSLGLATNATIVGYLRCCHETLCRVLSLII